MDDLKYLKKHYGEKFSHLCRELFPTLLQQEGLVSKVISEHFAPSRSLYEDILPLQDGFKAYVYSFVDVEQEKPQEKVVKTPEELMDEAGYILFPECQTEEDVQSFKKYYEEGEELCTFNGGRLNNCRVWFAVKKNVEQIQREDFITPKRQDEYGTSVISIQFSRGGNSTLSIKNRYNHTVNYPDATFSNNLDNIIDGLTQSFVETYKIHLMQMGNQRFEIPSYRVGDDGRFHKVNIEIADTCYCENNIALEHGEVVVYDPARYILADYFLIDKQKNIVTNLSEEEDAFPESLGEIQSIFTKTDKDGNKVVVFTPEIGKNVELTLDDSNRIIGYSDPNITTIGNGFLCFAMRLKRFNTPNLKTAGDCLLQWNEDLIEFNAPNLRSVGANCLYYNKCLTEFNVPNLEFAERNFLFYNKVLEKINAPKLTDLGDSALRQNLGLKVLHVPNLKKTGNFALFDNEKIEDLYAPKLTSIGFGSFKKNKSLKYLSLPSLKYLREGCFEESKKIEKIYAPKVIYCPNYLTSALTEKPIPKRSAKDKQGKGK